MKKKLTVREIEVLNKISLGYSSLEIASQLFVSAETIKTHRKNILSKLEARNTANMIRMAFEKNIFYNNKSFINIRKTA